MAKKITTIQELNKTLIECLDNIISIGSSTKGNKFDEAVRDKLQLHLGRAKYVKTDDWCSKKSNSIYLKHKDITSQNKFDFTGLPQLSTMENNLI